jgi:oligo-1,6-glucosidase
VITYISKKKGLPNDHLFPIYKGMPNYNHGPHIHEYLEEFKRDALDGYDYFTVAEAPMVSPEMSLKYIAEDGGQIDSMIQFQCECADCLFSDYMPLPFSLVRLKNAFSSWQYKLRGKAWNLLYIENHDHPRIISRYGSEKFWKESGKTLAASYLFQQGTPFIYQGQEIGMLNWRPESIEQYRDVQSIYQYHHNLKKLPEEKRIKKLWRSSRDSARTPVQWDDSPNAGFTTGETTWMDVNPNYTWLNAAQQAEDPDSILNFYKKAIEARKSLKSVRYGKYKEHFPLSNTLYCYTRECKCEKLLVLCSFSDKPQNLKVPKGYDLSKGELILQNYAEPLPGILQPYECRVYLFK